MPTITTQPPWMATTPTPDGHQKSRVRVWGVSFDRLTMEGTLERIAELIAAGEPSYVITANLNYLMLHDRDEALQRVTAEAGLVLADGQPIVWRSRRSGQSLPERVAGSELIYRLAARASEEGWRIYLLGGQPEVAAATSRRLTQLYPGIKIVGVESPPFRQLTDQEQQAQETRIRDSHPDILLVALGQPKGERWIADHYRGLGVPVSIQLGASFDFVAGTAQRAPRLMQRIGLEWAFRMLSDPRRLVPRYAANAAFLARALLDDLTGRRARSGAFDQSA